jgi:hypothetical protein
MTPTPNSSHVVVGVIVGAILQVLTWTILLPVIGMFIFIALPLGFGIVQVVTVLPAALIFTACRRPDVARGLLYFGTLLAIANVVAIAVLGPALLPPIK